MEFSILNIARTGITLLALTVSFTLQASQHDIKSDLEKLGVINCKGDQVIIPAKVVKEGIVPNSVLESQELWRGNAILLKDALELVALGSTGDELEVVTGDIIDNAELIGAFLTQGDYILDENSDRVEVILVEQAFTLYAYTFALRSAQSEVSVIEADLKEQNHKLLVALSRALGISCKKNECLAEALHDRLVILKEVAVGFADAAVTDSFACAYYAFNRSLIAGQHVGSIVGWKEFLHN